MAYIWGDSRKAKRTSKIVRQEKVGKEIKLIRHLQHTYTHTGAPRTDGYV